MGLTPAGVKALTDAGHTVLIETNAGAMSSFPDAEYQDAGAEIVGDAVNGCDVVDPVDMHGQAARAG